MDVPGLRYSVDAGVASIVIDRPERANALTMEMYEALNCSLWEAELDDSADVITITATGDEYFVPGGDLSSGADDWERDVSGRLAHVEGDFPYPTFERISKIVITGVNGMCQAAGIVIVLVSDLVVASENASFKVPEALRGLVEPFVPARLPSHVGLAKARWMMYTGEEMSAVDAERFGLVGKVVPHDDLGAAVDDAVAAVRRTGPEARARYKRLLTEAQPPFRYEEFFDQMRSPEAVEGMRSFTEKRPPSWRPTSD
ncbi:MAG: enoyl-CoA hydratase/isomerase family protein [Acidimicrobiia bacterium]